jgi:hypothetical protein
MEIKLNLVPFGKKDEIDKPHKGKPFPIKWKIYQKVMYVQDIEDDDNLILITGPIPDTKNQLIVVDFDGELDNHLYYLMSELGKYRVFPFQINRTCSGGLHFLIISDKKNEIRNKQGMKLKKGKWMDFIHDIDIRGAGGLVFYPPTKFTDKDKPYEMLYRFTGKDFKITRSEDLLFFIDDIYRIKKYEKQSPDIQRDIAILYNEKIRKMREPLKRLLAPGAIDIEELASETNKLEFLYWKALWLEAIHNDINFNVIVRLLQKHQPAFDYDTTVNQLRFIADCNPFTNVKLEELFPWWKAPKPSRKKRYRGFVMLEDD